MARRRLRSGRAEADEQLTLNVGVRFDQMFQYVTANQFSPRGSITYKPFWGTVFHTGYARNFTPPPQDLGRTVPNSLFDYTTNAPAQPNLASSQPERSQVIDAGLRNNWLRHARRPWADVYQRPSPPRTVQVSKPRDIYYKYA